MIRFCVGEKGSRKAIAEWWCEELHLLAMVRDVFDESPRITLAQVFDENGNFIKQYERL